MEEIKIRFIGESDIKLERPIGGMHHNGPSGRVCVLEDAANGIIIISKYGRSQLHNKEKCQEIFEAWQQLQLKDKMIEIMAKEVSYYTFGTQLDEKETIEFIKQQALAEFEKAGE